MVPATMFTGDETVEPFVGVHIVTEGFVVFSVHCAAANEGVNIATATTAANANQLNRELRERTETTDFDIGKLTHLLTSTQIAKRRQSELLKSSSGQQFRPATHQFSSVEFSVPGHPFSRL